MLARAIDEKPGAAPDLIDRIFGSDGWGRFVFALAGALLGNIVADMNHARPVIEIAYIAAPATIVFLIIQLGMSSRERRRVASPIQIAFSITAPAAPQLCAAANSRKHDIVKLTDLVGATPRLNRQVFEDCDIMGPAVIWMRHPGLEDCTILDDGPPIFLRLEDEHPPAGTIVVKDCLFRRCRFRNIGIAGMAGDLKRIRVRLTGARGQHP